MVIWCPSCQAQKMCEDRVLGSMLDEQGRQAEMDEAQHRLFNPSHFSTHRLGDPLLASRYLGRLARIN